MIDELILVPQRWRRVFGVWRIALSLVCLFVEIHISESSSILTQLLLVVFGIYSILVLDWKNQREDSHALFNLIVDSIFFLVCATIASEQTTLLCAAYFLFLMATAMLFHHWRQVLAASIVCVGMFPLIRPQDASQLEPALILAAILALLGCRTKQSLMERLTDSVNQTTRFRSESAKARETERERIVADFHDGPMQSFISLQMRLEVLKKLLERDPDSAMNELLQLQEHTRAQVAEIRAFVRSMRPVEIDGSGLMAAVSRLVDSFQKDTGISAIFLGGGTAEIEDPGLARELLKIVREALHNAQKHSGASRVAVGLEKANDSVEILIQDDGSGFTFTGSYSLEELDLLRLGPASIKRRVRALGGDLVVESRPGQGAGLKIRIPA